MALLNRGDNNGGENNQASRNILIVVGDIEDRSGGVVVSALEMVQNSLRYSWTRQEVDSRLKQIMGGIYDASAAAAEEYGLGYDLIAGNDIAAFKKINYQNMISNRS